MGNCCLPIRFRRTSSAHNPKSITLLLLGLDNSGKTTIAKRLTGEPIDSVVPTVGFSVVVLRQKGSHVSIYDLGGGPQIRDIWPRYYADAHGVIFVIDAHDVEKMETCRQVLENILRHEQISGKPILLLANKQDLDGALDEIDIVEQLNLEPIVNEQKCPTLVELCSALNFTKKLDIGIENGYKWLMRSIIREYPALNFRVLKDLAKQEEENKVEALKRVRRSKQENEDSHNLPDPFKPIHKVLGEKSQANGYIKDKKTHSGIKTVAVIPGLIEDVPSSTIFKTRQNQYPPKEEIFSVPHGSAKITANSYSSQFFMVEKFQSDLELLNDVPNHPIKNFLVRPKSSGARLYGVKSERKRKRKRKPLKKSNKTGPSPFTDVSNHTKEDIGNSSSKENILKPIRSSKKGPEMFEMKPMGGSKSTPNSRQNSVLVPERRRHSLVNGNLVSNRQLSTKELLLDVTKLGQ